MREKEVEIEREKERERKRDRESKKTREQGREDYLECIDTSPSAQCLLMNNLSMFFGHVILYKIPKILS